MADDPEQTAAQAVSARNAEGPRGGTQSQDTSLFRHLFARNRQEKSNTDVLAEIPLFDMLSSKELKLLAALVHERDYAAGELICEQGTPGAAMYIVKKGAVELFRQDAQGRPVRRMALLNEGAFFGEGALLEGSARFMSARAAEPTDALVFFRADLDQIVARQPITGTKILRKLAWVVNRVAEAALEELYKEERR